MFINTFLIILSFSHLIDFYALPIIQIILFISTLMLCTAQGALVPIYSPVMKDVQ